MLLDFVHPVLNGAEALAVRDIVGHDDTVRTLVVAAGDRLEALLAGRVPDLKLNSLSVYFNGSNFEIDSNSWHEVVSENIVL